jgi:hypothetical protein
VAPENIAVADARVIGASADGNPPPGSAAIENRLLHFRAIESRPLSLLVRALPWTVLAFVGVTLLYRNVDPMFITGLLAATCAAFLFGVLFGELPEVLGYLWKQQVFATRTSPGKQGADLAEAYLPFINNFQRDLNRGWSLLPGAAIAFLMFLSFSARFSNGRDWWKHPLAWLATEVRLRDWSYLVFAGSLFLLAFVLGLLLWRVLIVAVAVYRLDKLFDFKLQLQHPDHSSGLRPLGDICLTNALILSAPAIFLASWLIIIPGFGTVHNRYALYVPYYEFLLVVVFGLAVIAFALPLYGVHRGMLRQRARLEGSLYELATKIDLLTRRVLAEAISGPSDQLDKLSKDLVALEEAYALTSAIPTWPFDRAILRRFSVAQFIPLLTITGIAPEAVKMLEKVFSR